MDECARLACGPMDVHVQVFMDERARLARGFHRCACTGFHG